MAEETRIFTVTVDTSDLVKYRDILDDVLGTYDQNIAQLQQYNAAMKANAAEIKEMSSLEKLQGKLSDEQRKKIELLTAENRKLSVAKSRLQQVLKNEEKIMQSGHNTYERQSQTLGKLRMAWRQMTNEQKAANADMLASIQRLDAQVKAADAEIGNHQRNVGNYPQLLTLVGKGFNGIASAVPGLKEVSGALNGITSAANPVLAVVGAIAAVVKAATAAWQAYDEAVAGSAELTYELNDAMAESVSGADAITRHLQDTAGSWIKLRSTISDWWQTLKMWSISVIENIADRFTALSTIIEGIFTLDWDKVAEGGASLTKTYLDGGISTFEKMKADQAEILEIQKQINAKTKERDDLVTKSIVRRQELETQIAELERKAREEGIYSEQERLGFIRQAQNLIKEKFAIEQNIAKLDRDIAILEGEKTGNSVEVKQKIEQSKAGALKSQKQMNTELRQTIRLENTLRKSAEKNGGGNAQVGSIAFLEKRLAEANKAYKEAITQIDRETAKKLVELLKEQIRDLSTENLSAQLEIAVDILLNPNTVNINNPQDVRNALGGLISKKDMPKFATGEGAEERNGLGLTKEQQQYFDAAVSAYQQVFSTIEQMQQESIQRRLQDELDALNRETDSKKQALKAQQENGVISQKTYERKLNEIDKEAAAEQEELKKEAFSKQKKWNIASALINGALAITNLLANVPGSAINPATWVAIALATATTAAQVATIASQKYARGGLLHGKSHAQGGIKGYVEGNPIELEGGETVINKRSSRLFARELSAINSYNGWGVSIPSAGAPRFKRDLRFARGGVLAGYDFSPAPLPMSAAQVTTALNEQRDKTILQAIGAMVDAKIYNIRTTVLYDDIDAIGKEKRTVVSRATL